ncbi:MAG: hypothetical protein ACOZCO_12185 [Bacteroidota bacterium]
MTTINSNTVTVRNSAKEVHTWLCDMNNFRQLLPEDKISDWQSDTTRCSFKVQNAINIPLVFVSKTDYSLIHIKSGEKAPFPFTLDVHIKEKGENECEGHLVFNGELNVFLKMVAERPLENLFNHIAKRVVEVKSV